MCGFAGSTHRNHVAEPGRIQGATASLLHRGPDQQGFYCSPCFSLGAVRLKIIDLEGGDQPVASDDGDTIVAFNGEIYNHPELRTELTARGHRFRSRSDTEVLLRAFLEWDIGCFSHLRGMFAVALWTESTRRLVLARDRLGIKPLYLYRRGGDLHFGSELKAILEHPEVDRKLNLEGLDHYLSLNYVPCPHTLVEGIEKLPPGHWLEWEDGKIRTGQYWRLEFRPDRRRTLDSAKEELDSLLSQAVREHLISDVPLGIWASGGLDSSTILHYASACTTSRLKTFSISFRGRCFDETRYFRQVAGHYGTEHHELDLNPDLDLAGAIEQMVYYSDEPSADAGALPVWFLSRMSREHVTVALSGEGADELFGGYITYRADHWARLLKRVPEPLRRAGCRLLRRWPVSDDKVSFEYKLKRFLEGSLLAPDEAHCYWNGAFSGAEKRSFYLGSGARKRLFHLSTEQARDIGWMNKFLWFDQLYYLPDDILYKVDRMSMAHSLEVRPAFLDHRIVEFAASLPEEFKIRGSAQKRILRELMKDRLPPAILRRRKEGLDIPAHEWLRTALRPLLLDTLTPESVEESQVFRAGVIQEMVRNHLERRVNLGFHLWGLLILFLWMKRWNIRVEPAARESRAIEPVHATD